MNDETVIENAVLAIAMSETESTHCSAHSSSTIKHEKSKAYHITSITFSSYKESDTEKSNI